MRPDLNALKGAELRVTAVMGAGVDRTVNAPVGRFVSLRVHERSLLISRYGPERVPGPFPGRPTAVSMPVSRAAIHCPAKVPSFPHFSAFVTKMFLAFRRRV